MREFNTGATRDTDQGKLDFEGFLSPLVLERYAQFMNKNRKQADGKLRDSDNWQKGIPLVVYMKSMWRHFMDVWKYHRGNGKDLYTVSTDDEINLAEEALCAVIFNASGYLYELLKQPESYDPSPSYEDFTGNLAALYGEPPLEATTEDYPDPYEGIVSSEQTPPPPTHGW